MRAVILLILSLASLSAAQFGNLFDQLFGANENQGNVRGGHNKPVRPQNVPSDPMRYRESYEHSACQNYLCPDTLGLFVPSFLFLAGICPAMGFFQLYETDADC